MISHSRREFLRRTALIGTAAAAALGRPHPARGDEADQCTLSLGLVTYLWGKDWDLPTLLTNCQKAEILGVELRTTHAHGVERPPADEPFNGLRQLG